MKANILAEFLQRNVLLVARFALSSNGGVFYGAMKNEAMLLQSRRN